MFATGLVCESVPTVTVTCVTVSGPPLPDSVTVYRSSQLSLNNSYQREGLEQGRVRLVDDVRRCRATARGVQRCPPLLSRYIHRVDDHAHHQRCSGGGRGQRDRVRLVCAPARPHVLSICIVVFCASCHDGWGYRARVRLPCFCYFEGFTGDARRNAMRAYVVMLHFVV